VEEGREFASGKISHVHNGKPWGRVPILFAIPFLEVFTVNAAGSW